MDLQKLDLTKYPTVTLPEPKNFLDAVKALQDGHCLAIKPENNVSYLLPIFDSQGSCSLESGNFRLGWGPKGQPLECAGIRSDQLLGKWYLIVTDYRAFRVAT